MQSFVTYQLAFSSIAILRASNCQVTLRDQFLRAASSIALNLAKGYGKQTKADQRKFFAIAFGSAKKCQAILEITGHDSKDLDELNAHIYKLIKNTR